MAFALVLGVVIMEKQGNEKPTVRIFYKEKGDEKFTFEKSFLISGLIDFTIDTCSTVHNDGGKHETK